MSTATDELYWDRLVFRVKLYQLSGEGFQSTVSQLFEYRRPGFQSIAPWGRWGDGGNDGWIQSTGHYFQLYGPKPNTKFSPLDAVDKLVDDFNKLPTKWTDVRQYSFVLNDRFEGVPAPVASALQALASNHRLDDAGAIGAGQLMQEFMQLTRDQKLMIIGGVPSTIPAFVDSRAVGELLSTLADDSSVGARFLGSGKAPEFDKKIEFNGLTSPIRDHLRVYSYQAAVVDEFLDPRDPGLKQSIAFEIRDLYQQSKMAIPASDPEAANLRYCWLMDKLVPDMVKRNPHSLKAYREAAQIIIAKYFETCDAYDEPVSSVTA